MQSVNPTTIPAPNGTYSHGVLLHRPENLLFISGQVAIDQAGVIPDSLEAQAELVWNNLHAILKEAGMSMANVVKLMSFLTRADDFAAFARIRARHLGAHRPASTLLVVSALAHPKFLVEVEAIAVR